MTTWKGRSPAGPRRRAGEPTPDYEQLEATLLHCPRCRVAVPVRKRLLLVLPQGDKFEYVCTQCAATCGEKIESPGPGGLA